MAPIAAQAASPKLINGDFSYPAPSSNGAYLDIEGGKWQWNRNSWPISGYDKSRVGWRSTQTKVDDDQWLVAAGSMQIGQSGGNSFAELACHTESAIYQDIATVPNAVYKWSIDLCSVNKNHVDTISVMIGTTSSQSAQNAYRTTTNGAGDKTGSVGTVFGTKVSNGADSMYPRNQFERYTGSYLVPAGQNTTRFTFKAVDAAKKDAGCGLDNVSFQISYPLTYNLQGGTASGLNLTVENAKANNYAGYIVEGTSKTLSTVVPTKAGYTFLGWVESPSADATNKATYDALKAKVKTSITMPSTAKVMYAAWAKNPTVTYKDGDGTVKTETVAPGGTSKLPDALHKDGYIFKGFTAPGSSGVSLMDTKNVYEDTVRNAVWSASPYMVIFDPMGGEGEPDDLLAHTDESLTIPETAPTKTGYTFQGWKDEAEGIHQPNDVTVNLPTQHNSRRYLKAQWEANNYEIAYDANKGEGEMGNTEATYDVPVELSENQFTRFGYTFKGWSRDADGEVEYDDMETVTNLTAEDGGTVTLYAVWEADPYEIVFDANGGTGEPDPMESATDAEVTIPDQVPTREGYTFLEWKDEADGTHQPNDVTVNLPVEGEEQRVLTAQWRAHNYEIAYDANGGEGEMDNTEATYDVPVELSECEFTKPGYGFHGWALDPDGPVEYEDMATVTNLTAEDGSTVTLYAVWDENAPVRVRYRAFDPDHTKLSQDFEDIAPATGEAAGSVAEASRGYKFVDWVIGSGEEVGQEPEFVPSRGDDGLWHPAEYIAVVRPIHYTVVFDPMGGEGEPDDLDMAYDQSKDIPSDRPSLGTREFLGWATEDGKSVYNPGNTLRNLTDVDGDVIVLHALWGPERWTVTFRDADGKVIKTEVVEDGGAATSPELAERYGEKFVQWSVPFNEVHSDLIVDPVYEPVTHTVTFVDGQGNVISQVEVPHGDGAPVPEDPTRDGYSFSGWDKDVSCVEQDMVVTAQWTPYSVAEPVAVEAVEPEPTYMAQTGAGVGGVVCAIGAGIIGCAIARRRTRHDDGNGD